LSDASQREIRAMSATAVEPIAGGDNASARNPRTFSSVTSRAARFAS
jgi:hypothetical protein